MTVTAKWCWWLLATVSMGTALGAVTATIDLATTHQVVRGFGGATVYRPTEPFDDHDLDLLFGDEPGQIGFSILRIRVSTDPAWREVELANALGARARGAAVVATPWSPPAEWKSNNNLMGGRLLPAHYADYANYLNAFAAFMADRGAPLYAISVQNEPDYQVTYESCDWTPQEMLTFCRDYAGVITSTRVIAPESFQYRKNISDPLLADPVALANVDLIGGHIYGGGLEDYPAARAAGKEVWMTEHLDLLHDWPNALNTAKEMHLCLVDANFSAYIWWYLKRYYGPLGEDGVVTKRGHVMSHFARFIRPGYVRVDATAKPSSDLYVSAFKADRLVIVAVNTGNTAVEQTFRFTGGTVAFVTPWTTTESLNANAGSPLAITAGSFTATLPASSVTTFVGELVLPMPTMASPPASHSAAPGDPVVLTVEAEGDALSYQWFHDGTPLTGATTSRLFLESVLPNQSGDYTVAISNSGGTVTSDPATLAIRNTDNAGRLINLSTRSIVGQAGEPQIGGFVISGSTTKTVLIRAAGPVLQAEPFGLREAIDEPQVQLFDQSTGEVIAFANTWDERLAPTFVGLGAFAWPRGSRDAALEITLQPGVYTAVVKDTRDRSGITLLEIYDAAPGDSTSALSNLSTRSLVQVGNAAQIGGLVVGGETDLTILLRASGPALRSSFGLTQGIGDPSLELYDQATGRRISSATAWDAELGALFARLGAFPWSIDSNDAALLVTLAPGAYSVVVQDQTQASGLSLLEVYVVR